VLDETDNVEEIIKQRIQDYKKRHGDIMRAGEQWRTKLLNLKTLAIALGVIVIAILLGRFLGFF